MHESITANLTIDALYKLYGDVECTLNFTSPFQLLVATILSAQCTDKKVNEVTPQLFELYGTPKKLAKAKLSDVERIIKPLGFYHTKSYNLIECAKKYLLLPDLSDLDAEDIIKKLTTLNGVGRKTANLIAGEVYGVPAVVTDTHVIRITGRLGLTSNKTPEKIEQDLRKLIEPKKQLLFCHLLVAFGRDICKSQNPKCGRCPLTVNCKHFASIISPTSI